MGFGATGVNPVVLFTGAVPALFFSVLADFVAGVLVTSFLTAPGNGFFVPRGVLGFDAALMVFFAGVVVEGVEVDGTVFFVAVDDAVGVAFVGAVAVFPGVDVAVPAEPSFFGTFFTGVAVEVVVFVAVAAGFLTGVALVAADVVFAGVAVVGFFAVD